jgi:hypothetical protein
MGMHIAVSIVMILYEWQSQCTQLIALHMPHGNACLCQSHITAAS